MTTRPDAATARVVPWLTVLPLAAVMAYADGFWLVSLRGAVGAIERTQQPFTTWWREATLALPIFVVAVIGAMALALRWFGTGASRTRTVLLTALLVALAGTLAGVVELAASSAYDYRLQVSQLEAMSTMRGNCPDGCLHQQRDATLWLQVRSVGWGSALILVTNLVGVAWLVAMRGGRLALTSSRRTAAGARYGSRVDDLGLFVAVGLVGAAAIHVVAVPEHLEEWAPAGAFFVVLAAVELAVATVLLARPGRGVLTATAAVSLAPLGLWVYTRTAGLPFGPEAGVAERVGVADCAACALELATFVVAAVVLRREPRLRRRPAVSQHARSLAVVSMVAVTTLGIAGLVPGWVDGSTVETSVSSAH